MQTVCVFVILLSTIVYQVDAGSALIIAEKMLGTDDGYCQRACEERPGCIFSYCGDDNKCHSVGTADNSEVVSCGATSTSFDSCTSACESVPDCAASSWKSFCKSWLDIPVCFGLVQNSNGVCYEATPGCTGTAYVCP
ncbi:hypothetical protein Pmar_PMAR011719 [Perkinsus marinus ATCC 50983]|uniref:Uncharacterized protein n=1 Tax=Perkinsus marinus (strain ATCC 50983 / TXsc) TaxID=423536 RepID=C5LCJ0_PERM5|nr:hypothetical protein Pmar_PMAR011719 [Perkinsus marinus ATCC 50983]EER05673.1 hypothetical protein Pmar_PMAR011719 [Perkinsus marinus ATCC 50983]|eukprot:XP_002773857.1 hypothetical protein Pmar_PMAR011719 [Perkinsus marinus ATCC 50983]